MTDLAKMAEDLAAAAKEMQRLQGIADWAMSVLHVQEGDRVALTETLNTNNGWSPYREVLKDGNTGKITKLDLGRNGFWFGYFTPEVCWSVSDFQKATRYVQIGKCFVVRLEQVRLATDDDKPIPLPEDASDRWVLK